MSASTAEDPPRCQQCRDPIDESSNRRVVSSIEDGTVVHRHFCSDDCLEDWERPETA